MKIRKLAVFLVGLVVFGLTGCGEGGLLGLGERELFTVKVRNATFCEYLEVEIGDRLLSDPTPPQSSRIYEVWLVPEEQYYYSRRNRRERVDITVGVRAEDADGVVVLSDQKVIRNAQEKVTHSVTFDENDFTPALSCPRE